MVVSDSTDQSNGSATDPGAHQGDPARRRRLRWRARRGLLENDLLISAFLDAHEHELTDSEVAGLDCLLALSDNDLLDLIFARSELSPDLDRLDVREILKRLSAGVVARPGSAS